MHQGEQDPPRGLTPQQRVDLARRLNTREYDAYDVVWVKSAEIATLRPLDPATRLPGAIAASDAVAGVVRRFLWEELELITPEHVLWDDLASSTWFPCPSRAAGMIAAAAEPPRPALATELLALFDPATVSFLTNVPAATEPRARSAPAVIGLDDAVIGMLWFNG